MAGMPDRLTDEEMAAFASQPSGMPDRMSDEEMDALAPSRLASIGRGIAGGAGGLLDAVDYVGRELNAKGDAMARRFGLTPSGDAPRERSFTERFQTATGIPAAVDRTGENLEAAGSGLALAPVTIPMAIAAAPALGVAVPTAIAADLGLSALSGVVSRETEAATGSPMLAMAAGALTGGPQNTVARTGQRIATHTGIQAARGVEALMTPAARALADSGGHRPRTMVEVARQFKSELPDIEAARQVLAEADAINQTSGVPGGITTRQALESLPNNRGGAVAAHMEERLSRTVPEFGTARSRRRADVLDWTEEQLDELAVDDAGTAYGYALADGDYEDQLARAAERSAWNAVHASEKPSFDMTGAQVAALDAIQSAKLTDDIAAIPTTFRDILDPRKFQDPTGNLLSTFSLDDFQAVRSNLLATVREASTNPSKATEAAARHARNVLDAMGAEFDRVATADTTGKSLQYRQALDITRERNRLWDPRSPVIQAMSRGGSPSSLFSAMRNATGRKGARIRPVDEARRLVEIYSGDEAALDNLRRIAIRDLYNAGTGNPLTNAAPRKILDQHEQTYRVLLGDDLFERVHRRLSIARMASTGKAGTSGQVNATGSGVAGEEILTHATEAGGALFSGNVGTAAKGAVKAGSAATLGRIAARRQREFDALRRLVAEDPGTAVTLIDLPVDPAIPGWIRARRAALNSAKGGSAGALGSANQE